MQAGKGEEMEDAIVRNDEVVGSSPTSSTIIFNYLRLFLVLFCPKLVQNRSVHAGVCLTLQGGMAFEISITMSGRAGADQHRRGR